MKSFFKIVFGSMVGFFLSYILLLLVIVIIFGVAVSGSKKSTPSVVDNSILLLKLNYPIAERTNYANDNFSFSNFEFDKNIGLNDLIKNIHRAASDAKIKGIFIDARMMTAGMATTEALRNALLDFKQSKKPIYAYSELMSQKSYYLCSVADKIYLNPRGHMEFAGLSTTIPFIKGTLDKVGIEPQIFYCGKFKSASEPLRLTKMSDANRLQTTEFLGDMFDHLLTGIAAERKVSKSYLDSVSNLLLVRNASAALRYKMVDQLAYYDEVLNDLRKITGTPEKDEFKFLEMAAYDETAPAEKYSKDKIAVVFAEGDIVDGKGADDNIGGEKFAKIIRDIRNSDNTKALVLRVNSPGGSALASDIIWRELLLTKKKMPVVVSMGDYAASGGYYISCMADSIFAQPNTLTGSIGVFGILPNMQKFFTDKLGITFDGVKTGKYSDLPTISRPMTDDEKAIVQDEIDTIYADFRSRVTEGRHKSAALIDSVAQGRVWSGKAGLKIGLVDKMGGLDDAIACARRLSKSADARLMSYPEVDNALEKFLYDFSEDRKTSALKEELGMYYDLYTQIKKVQTYTTPQARLPFVLEIK